MAQRHVGGESLLEARLRPVALDVVRHADAEELDAPERWRELLGSRWAVVDAFESDGHRIWIAKGCEADVTSNLDTRDRIILVGRASGASLKVIASQVGLSLSSTARRLQRAMRCLGLRSVAGLAALLRAGDR